VTTDAQVPVVPAWRVGRVLKGIALGLIAHAVGMGVAYYYVRTAKGLAAVAGLEIMFCIEAVNAVVIISYGVVLLRRRPRDLVTGLLAAWLIPIALFGILTGLAELRG
jgi:hypothetical protein